MEAVRAGFVALAVVAAVTLPLPASASAGPAVAEPELTLEKTCGEVPGIRVTVSGFPANTPYTATLQLPGGDQIGPGQILGNSEPLVGALGAGTGTYTFTFVWSGGTIQESIFVTCTITKEDCLDGGWRQFRPFKNQGQCVAFVQRGPKGEPEIFLDASCQPFDPYGGQFYVIGLEPNTEYQLRYISPGGGGHSFGTNALGAQYVGGAVSSEPFEIGIRIWRDLNHNFLVDDGEEVAVEAHFTVDQPCEDVFPDST